MRHTPTILPLLALLTCWFCLSTRSAAAAATIPVDGTTCTLIDAIHAANSDTASGGSLAGRGADTITLANDVSLSVSNNNGNGTGSTGLPMITSPITIQGGGYTISRASGAVAFRLFYVASSGTLTVTQTTLTGGNDRYFKSGGIYNDHGTLTVSNSTLSGNSVTMSGDSFSSGIGGGGIYNDHGTLTVITSTLTGNSATSNGGAGGTAGNRGSPGVNGNGGMGHFGNSGHSGINGSRGNSGCGIYNAGGIVTLMRTFTIRNSGTAALSLSGVPLVAVSGDSAFTVSTQPVGNSVAAEDSITFQLTFAPPLLGW